MEFLSQFVQGLSQAWQRLTTSARVNIALAFLLTAAIIGVTVYVGSRPQYVDLFTNLSPEDMVAVQGKLESEGVPYQIDSTGKTIQVPIKYRSDMRVKVNAAGLVRSQGALPGFELFNTANFMQNQFTQDVNLQRALMGELQRNLNEYTFIRRSFVNIQQAEDEIFASEQRPAVASVTLDVAQPLTEEQINAVIGTIVSYGRGNLRPENINLATTDGRVLNAPAQDDFDSVANSKMTFARNYRNDLKREAENALRRLGVKSVVTVTLDVDHSSVKEKTEEVRKGTPISSMTITNTTTSRDTPPEGPAGARANLPDDAPVPGGTSTSQEEEQTLENFEPSRTVIEKITTPGSVKVQRVTAIVDGRYEDELDSQGAPTGKKTYVARSKQELDTYKELVAAATGVTDENIQVRDHPFELEQLATAATAVAGAATGSGVNLVEWGGYAARILLVLMLLFALRYFLMRAAVGRDRLEEDERLELPKASPAELRKREMATEVERVSQEQPEAVASLLRTWLSESEE